MPEARFLIPTLGAIVLAAGLGWSIAFIATPSAEAGTMVNDPKGFNGIPWGASLESRPELTLVNSTSRIKEYDLKNGPMPLGDAKVETMRFSTFDGQFTRVTIRYLSQGVHAQVLAHLQAHYGPLDRTPGQTMRGLNQQYNWRGTDTEINMTYEGQDERGFVFIESTVLAPRFNDTLPDTAY